MGKQGWYASKWDGGGWDSNASQRQRANWQPQKDHRGDTNGKTHLVGYKDVKATADDARLTGKREEEALRESKMTVTQIVQRAVNQARKARTKHKKTIEELQWHQTQWDAYCRQMKEAFQQQYAAFQKDKTKLEEEIERTEGLAADAERHMKAVLQSQERRDDAEMMDGVFQESEDDDAWDRLIQGDMAEKAEAEDAHVAAYLQRAQQAAQDVTRRARAYLQESGVPTNREMLAAAQPDRAGTALLGNKLPTYGPSPATRQGGILSDPYCGAVGRGLTGTTSLEPGQIPLPGDAPITPARRPAQGMRSPDLADRRTPAKTSPKDTKTGHGSGLAEGCVFIADDDDDDAKHRAPSQDTLGRLE